MSGAAAEPTIRRLRRRRGGIFRWAVVACVAAVLIEVGAVTDGFGIPAAIRHGGGSSSGPGFDPANPYDENVTEILSSISYGGGREVFPALQGSDLCDPGCPEAPTEMFFNYTPPVAGLWFYFNVTNVGPNISVLSNFTLSSSGPDPHLFVLAGITCCYPTYEEEVGSTDFGPSGSDWDAWGFSALVVSSYIPSDGPTGYVLYLNSTSP
jgi:hypothetical protein